jgi:hypothetical protein
MSIDRPGHQTGIPPFWLTESYRGPLGAFLGDFAAFWANLAAVRNRTRLTAARRVT